MNYTEVWPHFNYADFYNQFGRVRRAVEVGCWIGLSTAHLARLADEVIAVDIWKPTSQMQKYWDALKGRHPCDVFREITKPVSDRITVRNEDSCAAASGFPDGMFDLVFLDDDHTREGVYRSINAWRSKVRPGGILAGHDYCESWPEVMSVVDELIPDRVVMGNTVWCVEVGRDPLVQAVTDAIGHAEDRGELPQHVLNIPGFSSPKVRRFLNKLLSRILELNSRCQYLEVGSLHGSTLISALWNNPRATATAVDNFSEFGGSLSDLERNCLTCIQRVPHLVEANIFECCSSTIGSGHHVLFYDGHHSEESHNKAIVHLCPYMADRFVLVVDDSNRPEVMAGTHSGMAKAGVRKLMEVNLTSRFNGDLTSWWNGLYVAVCERPLRRTGK